MIILIGFGLFFLFLIIWGMYNRHLEEKVIHDWEKSTGLTWIREGYIKKGGHNGIPRFDRPPPPKSQVSK